MTKTQNKKRKAYLFNLRRAEVLAYKENEQRYPDWSRSNSEQAEMLHTARMWLADIAGITL
jgi:hypothetical protein